MRPQKTTGYSLLEVMMTLGIFLIVVFGLSAFISQNYRATLFADEQSEAIQQARRGVEQMVKEIREALPAENGAYPIELANDQTLIFYSDLDADELVERVRYTLEGTNLVKGVTEPEGFPPAYTTPEETTILSRYVQNGSEPIFFYLNGNYPTDTEDNPLQTPAPVNQIRLVRVFLEINVDPSRAPENFALISNSQLRNLKDNL